MKFVISSSQLHTHLTAIGRVVSSRSTLPILDCFLFTITGKDLQITASDLENTLITKIRLENKTDKDGGIAIPAKILLDTLKEFKDQILTFEIDTDSLSVVIKSDTGVFNIVGQSSVDFPVTLGIKDDIGNTLSVNADALLDGINKTIFATAEDELRPVLGGVFVDATESDITFVGTDAHKLVRYIRTDAKANNDKACSFILPKKAASLLKNILAKEAGEVEVKFDNNNASFGLDEYRMVCRLIEGNYPKYNSVIPKDAPIKAVVRKEAIYKAIKRVSVYANQSSNLIILKFSKNKLTVSGQDLDFSISANESLSCEYTDIDIEIGFKSTFLLELLSSLSSADVVFKLTDPTRAGLILPTETSNENEDTLMLLMPMMIS